MTPPSLTVLLLPRNTVVVVVPSPAPHQLVGWTRPPRKED